MQELLTEGFLCEYAPGRVVVGWGPFVARPERIPAQLACYAPDFFLDDPAPWKHPRTWRELTRDEILGLLPPTRPPALEVAWEPPDPDAYVALFRDILQRIARGDVSKVVPVVVERGRVEREGPALVHALLRAALDVPATSLVYGLWERETGLVGASPEILFRHLDGGTVETVAIAGTVPTEQGSRLVEDPKEVSEQQSVVEDIVQALKSLGTIDVAPRELLCLPQMTHLKTDIVLHAAEALDLVRIVRALHPTAAVGVAPRTAGLALLRTLDADAARGRLGAPFGIEWPDGRSACLVAIRNVQWTGRDLALGAGGGLIAQSALPAEWEELRLKRDAVKRMLGL